MLRFLDIFLFLSYVWVLFPNSDRRNADLSLQYYGHNIAMGFLEEPDPEFTLGCDPTDLSDCIEDDLPVDDVQINLDLIESCPLFQPPPEESKKEPEELVCKTETDYDPSSDPSIVEEPEGPASFSDLDEEEIVTGEPVFEAS